MEAAQRWMECWSLSWNGPRFGVSAPDLRFTEAAGLPRSAKYTGRETTRRSGGGLSLRLCRDEYEMSGRHSRIIEGCLHPYPQIQFNLISDGGGIGVGHLKLLFSFIFSYSSFTQALVRSFSAAQLVAMHNEPPTPSPHSLATYGTVYRQSRTLAPEPHNGIRYARGSEHFRKMDLALVGPASTPPASFPRYRILFRSAAPPAIPFALTPYPFAAYCTLLYCTGPPVQYPTNSLIIEFKTH